MSIENRDNYKEDFSKKLSRDDIKKQFDEYYKSMELTDEQQEYINSREMGNEYYGNLNEDTINVLDGYLEIDHDFGGDSGLIKMKMDLQLLDKISPEKQKDKLKQIIQKINEKIAYHSIELADTMTDGEFDVKSATNDNNYDKRDIQKYLGKIIVYKSILSTSLELLKTLNSKSN